MNELTTDHPQKNFQLKPSENPDNLLAIRLREQVCDDERLSDGAVRLFVRLLDMALNSFLNNGHKGKVIISQEDLGKLIKCDERSIRRRVTELVSAAYIWTSLMYRRNTKPMRVYHVTAYLPNRQAVQEIPGEGIKVNGSRRYDHGFEKTGNEAVGQNRRMGSSLVDRHGKQIFFNLPANAPESGQNWPHRADAGVLSERTVASSARGHLRPLTEDSSVLSERSKLSSPSGQNCPATTGEGVRPIEPQLEPESPEETSNSKNYREGSSSKGLKPFSPGEKKWPQGLKPLPLIEERNIETLRSLAARYNGTESAHKQRRDFGRQWRMRTREDAEKMERVMAEVHSAVKENRITGLVGEYFNTIWNEFASRKAAV